MSIPVFFSLHVETRDSQPKLHCVYDHLPNEGSIEITKHPHSVYLTGSRSEIVDWARRVIAAAHELPKA